MFTLYFVHTLPSSDDTKAFALLHFLAVMEIVSSEIGETPMTKGLEGNGD